MGKRKCERCNRNLAIDCFGKTPKGYHKKCKQCQHDDRIHDRAMRALARPTSRALSGIVAAYAKDLWRISQAVFDIENPSNEIKIAATQVGYISHRLEDITKAVGFEELAVAIAENQAKSKAEDAD